jgi:hypothetical protein
MRSLATSPIHQIPVIDQADDVFERLAKCDRLLTARELGDILAISPKDLVQLRDSWNDSLPQN